MRQTSTSGIEQRKQTDVKNDSCRSVFALCMFLRRRKEEMVFIQENWIEHRIYDITCKSWLLSSNLSDRSPSYFSLDMLRNFEVAGFGKFIIDLQKSFLFSFRSGTRTDFNELPHEFVQHLALLPFFKFLPRRTLIKIKVLKIEGQLWDHLQKCVD